MIPGEKEGPTKCFGASNYQKTSGISVGICQRIFATGPKPFRSHSCHLVGVKNISCGDGKHTLVHARLVQDERATNRLSLSTELTKPSSPSKVKHRFGFHGFENKRHWAMPAKLIGLPTLLSRTIPPDRVPWVSAHGGHVCRPWFQGKPMAPGVSVRGQR